MSRRRANCNLTEDRAQAVYFRGGWRDSRFFQMVRYQALSLESILRRVSKRSPIRKLIVWRFGILGDVKNGPLAGKFDEDDDEQPNWSLVKGF